MRMLLGAIAVAASFVHADTRTGQVQTLYTSPAHRTIAAFAQDDGLVAWFTPGSKSCNAVWLWQLGGAQQHLPAQGAGYHNVTCAWQVPPDSPVGLAVARNSGCTSRIKRAPSAARRLTRRVAMNPGKPVMNTVSLKGIRFVQYLISTWL